MRGYVVLTENKGAIMISEVINEYRDVVVWRVVIGLKWFVNNCKYL